MTGRPVVLTVKAETAFMRAVLRRIARKVERTAEQREKAEQDYLTGRDTGDEDREQ